MRQLSYSQLLKQAAKGLLVASLIAGVLPSTNTALAAPVPGLPSYNSNDYEDIPYQQAYEQAENEYRVAVQELQARHQDLEQGHRLDREMRSRLEERINQRNQIARRVQTAKDAIVASEATQKTLAAQIIEAGQRAAKATQDRDANEQSIVQRTTNKTNADQSVINAQTVLNSLTIQRDQAQAELNSVKAPLGGLDSSIAAKKARQKELTDIIAAAEPGKSYEAEKAELANVVVEISNLEGQRAALVQKIQSAQSKLDAQNALVAAQNSALDSAKANAASAAQQLQVAIGERTRLTEEITKNTSLKANLEQRLNNEKQNELQLQVQQANAERDLVVADNEVREAQHRAARSSEQLEHLRRRREMAERVSRDREAIRNQAHADWQRVLQNITTAESILGNLGAGHGQADGQREGTELGSRNGREDGEAEGKRIGKEQGIAEGIERAEAEGRKIGKAEGEKIGTDQALAQAEANGQKDGRELGTAQGLAQAFKDGDAAGYAEGVRTGGDSAAYGRGRAIGEANGNARALSDAAPLEKKTYELTKAAYLDESKLKKATLGENFLDKQFDGLQGRFSEYGEDKYYAPTRVDQRDVPHPRLLRSYQVAYDGAYRFNLDETYKTVYRNVEDITREQFRRATRDEYLAKDYSSYREKKRETIRERTRGETYDRVYPIEYAKIKENYRKSAFEANKTDAGKTAEGKAVGLARGSQEKGDKDGFKAAYDAAIEPAKQAATKRGKDTADEEFTQHAVSELESIELIEADQDGIYRPGEKAFFKLVIKNFGALPDSGLKVLVGASGQGIKLNSKEALVPTIDGTTKATVYGVGDLEILANAQVGMKFQTTSAFKNAGKPEKDLSRSFDRTVQYPVETKIVGFDGTFVPGEVTTLKVSVRNISKKTQKLSLKMDATPAGRVNLTNASQAIASLKAGEVKSLSFQAKGLETAIAEELDVEVVTRQGNLQWGANESAHGVVGARYKFNPNSIGLIIAADGYKGLAKELKAKVADAKKSIDVWNLRIDKTLSDKNILETYRSQGKVIHLLADKNFRLDPALAQNLTAIINATGATVVVWGSELGQTDIISQIGPTMGVASAQETALQGAISGDWFLRQLALPRVAGSVASLKTAGNGKAVSVLKSGSATIGVMNHFFELSNKPASRVITLGLSPAAIATMSTVEFSEVVNRLNIVKLDFDGKIEYAKQNLSQISFLVDDVVEEIAAVGRVDKNFYSDYKNSKLFAVMQKFLDKANRGPVRDSLVLQYPTVRGAIDNQIPGFQPSMYAKGVINKKVTYKEKDGGLFGSSLTWKEFYCKANRAAPVCGQSGQNEDGF